MTTETRAALAELCALYWLPVYAFVRRSGHGPENARDLTQSFFMRILEHNDLASADPQRGRFRNWLLGALKHFLANDRRREHTQKRGGGSIVLSIDVVAEEDRYLHEPADSLTPERVYEHRWALTVLEHVMNRLEREYAKQGKRERFEKLKPFLVGDEPPYETLAAELGEAAGALRQQVFRMRRRYRDLLREEISNTVATPADVDDELRSLFAALLP
jgi:RNA polymerase sigma factor (sigma-70 family)